MNLHPNFSLQGKVALVTGGSRGLGRAMALGFAAAGADVVVTSRNLESCEAVCDDIRAMGRKALAYACHAGRWDQLDGLVDAVYESFGNIDILVNNAGMSPVAPSLLDISEKLWDSIFALNLKGPFRLSVLIGSRMAAANGGSIINISAAGALRPKPYIAPYAAAKMGVMNITTALAQEFGPKVRVNCIVPGAFRTDVAKTWAPGKYDTIAALGRVGEPEEVIGTALYLASEASSFTSGAIISVDGAWI